MSELMQQTAPHFIIKKYRSILWATVIVEAVNYIVSLTDSVVAGNILGSDALAAIGVLAPFMAVATFVASIVNSGTVMRYSYYVGCFDKKRAGEITGQGVFMALAAGAVYVMLLYVLKNPVLAQITPPGEVRDYANQYYDLILPLFFLLPVSYLSDSLLVADGGEKLSTVANLIFIFNNIGLSVLFADWWGIRGIAIASVLSELLFILLIGFHFLGGKNNLQMVAHWSKADFMEIFRNGIVKASTHVMEAILILIINFFALRYFDKETLILLVLVENFLGLLTVFIGLAMAAQPLIGTLVGEKNTRALRALMRTVLLDMLKAGLVLTVLVLLFAPTLVRAFGISEKELLGQGVVALRIVGTTLIPHAVLVLFFVYYYLIGEQKLAFTICVRKNLISPAVLAIFLAVLMKSQMGMWIGLMLAPITAFLICVQAIYVRYGKNQFVWLLPRERDARIFIYDFALMPKEIAALSRTVQNLLKQRGVNSRTCNLIAVYVEDVWMLIREKNQKRENLKGECTLIIEDGGVRVIFRDSGTIFNITDEDAPADSFRQYIVANMMMYPDWKANMTTTGYNRNELFFGEGING